MSDTTKNYRWSRSRGSSLWFYFFRFSMCTGDDVIKIWDQCKKKGAMISWVLSLDWSMKIVYLPKQLQHFCCALDTTESERGKSDDRKTENQHLPGLEKQNNDHWDPAHFPSFYRMAKQVNQHIFLSNSRPSLHSCQGWCLLIHANCRFMLGHVLCFSCLSFDIMRKECRLLTSRCIHLNPSIYLSFASVTFALISELGVIESTCSWDVHSSHLPISRHFFCHRLWGIGTHSIT